MTWHTLLFAHWPVDEKALRPHVPEEFVIDRFEERAWIAVVPFAMSNVAPRGVPAIPLFSDFPELNVRTYVRARGRPGVYFFSLDAANPLAVLGARMFFYLPYFTATMSVDEQGGWVRYYTIRKMNRGTDAEFKGRYRPRGPARAPSSGTLEHFLTERYCLFTIDSRRRPRMIEIHHPPWPLQSADAEIEANTMAAAAGIALPSTPPLLHFARRQDVVVWPLTFVA